MNHPWWPKFNKEAFITFVFFIKIGVMLAMKTGLDYFVESIFKLMSRHQYTLLWPSIILVGWFPISFFIDFYLIQRYGVLAIWWCIVDIYTTYILVIILRLFFKKHKANGGQLA